MGYVTYEVKDNIGFVCIHRPETLNALNSAVLDDLSAVFDQVDTDVIRCLILSGAGDKSFVAGADISQMAGMSRAEGEALSQKGNDVFLKIERFPIPVIAAVNGYALGGGCELAMACDIRLCSENALFGQPEAGIGITPGFGGTQRLSRIVGLGMAKQLIFTARNIRAEEALRIGLVNAVLKQEELMPAAEKMAKQIASNAPVAVRACKEAINEGAALDISEAVKIEERLFASCFDTEDQKEGMRAFLEKRKDKQFKNR